MCPAAAALAEAAPRPRGFEAETMVETAQRKEGGYRRSVHSAIQAAAYTRTHSTHIHTNAHTHTHTHTHL